MNSYFGLIVIGDEILYGDREDLHQTHFRSLLKKHGRLLHRCWFIPDQRKSLVKHLKFSITEQLPVFVCGGIGATPDDLTRSCAAEAFETPLQRHPEAKQMIETQFGEAAYPTRINMADLPMESINRQYKDLKMYSLPRFGTQGSIELGLRGDREIDRAFEQLQQQLTELKIAFKLTT
ncbi:MAG: molybdopterin-binding protein [Candidatus Thiodiazotropha lotti]